MKHIEKALEWPMAVLKSSSMSTVHKILIAGSAVAAGMYLPIANVYARAAAGYGVGAGVYMLVADKSAAGTHTQKMNVFY